MKELIGHATAYRACVDWDKVRDEMADPARLLGLVGTVTRNLDAMRDVYRLARRIADAYPKSDGARVLREMLEVGCEREVMRPGFKAALVRREKALKKKYPPALSDYLEKAAVTALQPALRDIRLAAPPRRNLKWTAMPCLRESHLLDARPAFNGKDGLVYIRGALLREAAGRGELRMGADGPFRVWVNGRPAGVVPAKGNPATADEFRFPVTWKKGRNEVLVALGSNKGNAWGVQIRVDEARPA
jgi:hypothetical protein